MDEIYNLQVLAGLKDNKTTSTDGSNISITAAEKAQLMRDRNIKPGTDEWFKLWFSKPYMTGEKPI